MTFKRQIKRQIKNINTFNSNKSKHRNWMVMKMIYRIY